MNLVGQIRKEINVIVIAPVIVLLKTPMTV
jgi:hypothetical protein